MQTRDEDTDKKAVAAIERLPGLSAHGAQVAVRGLTQHNFVIMEVVPDQEDPEAPPYGSIRSIYRRLDKIEKMRRDIHDEERGVVTEWGTAIESIRPFFKAMESITPHMEDVNRPFVVPDEMRKEN